MEVVQMSLTTEEKISLIRYSNKMIKILFGWKEGEGERIGLETKWGEFNFIIWTDHLDFLEKLNTVITDGDGILDYRLIGRWKLVNELIVTFFKPPKGLNPIIKGNSLNLASIIAFLLLEEVARIKSNKWDENGKLLENIPESFGLTKMHSNGKIKPHSYKKDQTIVLLAHKLYLLKSSLRDDLQQNIDGLDKVLRKPFFPGNNQELSPLFERLESIRNRWLHGREFGGWEGIFISFFLCTIYFEPTEKEIQDYEKRIGH